MIYIAVLCNSRITAEPLYNTPLVHWTQCRCQQYGDLSMKALARYRFILLGEQRHIRCKQLAQGCCSNNAAVGVEPATSRSRVQRPAAALPSHHQPLWTTNHNKAAVRGLVSQPITAYISHLTGQLSVTTLVVASGTPATMTH